jgi:pimeloyl-ACP methyl ester carboxylesterase
MTSNQFDRVYAPLASAGIRAIGVDTPGFGMSDPPPGPPSISDYATSIPAVLDHLGIAQANLCGHHTGAKIITEAALAYPDRASKLILSGPAPMTPEEQQQFIDTILAGEKAFQPRPDGSHFSDLFVKRLPWIKDHPDALQLCTRYTIQNLMGLGPFWYGHHAAFHYDSYAALPRLTQPTLVLINTGDMLYPHAQKTMQLCPHFAYAELNGGGIDITDQDPEGWTREVVAFIQG